MIVELLLDKIVIVLFWINILVIILSIVCVLFVSGGFLIIEICEENVFLIVSNWFLLRLNGKIKFYGELCFLFCFE